MASYAIPCPIPHPGEGRDRDPERTSGRDGGRGLHLAARRTWHRIRVCQCRHRFCPDRRGAVPQEGQRQGAAVHGGSPRERRHGDGARLLPDRRQAGRRHGACHGRHRQHPQRGDQRLPRQHSGAARRRPHADHRDRQHRVAQPADPLGPGSVRPGRHAARIREVGLRAARRPAGRGGGRPRARHRDERAARAGVPDTAARSAERPDRSHAPQHGAAARLACARTGAGGDRGGDADDRQGRIPDHRHLGGRPGRGVRSANSRR